MRFLVREKPFERLVAAGELRYWQNDAPTGAVEQWRITRTPGGDRIVRVDLDGRRSDGKRSALFHYLCSPEGDGQRLVYRLLQSGGETVGGSVLFTNDHLVNSRRNHDVDELPLQPLLFPSTTCLALLASLAPSQQPVALLDVTDRGRLRQLAPAIEQLPAETVMIGSEPRLADVVRLRWQNQQRRLWLHDGLPLKMARQDGLSAVASHTIRYDR